MKRGNKKFEIKESHSRHFSEEFKRQKVKELLKGVVKVRDLCGMYGISRTSVYKWLYLYSSVEKGTKTVVQMESEAYKTQQLLLRVAELERIIGQKQMEIDYLNKAFEVASEQLGYDVKKKHVPSAWNGSVGTEKNTPTK